MERQVVDLLGDHRHTRARARAQVDAPAAGTLRYPKHAPATGYTSALRSVENKRSVQRGGCTRESVRLADNNGPEALQAS
jgi:hypothetical protein